METTSRCNLELQVLVHFGKRQRPGLFPLAPFRIAIIAVFGEWLSLVEHLVRDQGVGGSNPLSPTIYFQADVALSGIAKNPDVDDFVAVRASEINK